MYAQATIPDAEAASVLSKAVVRAAALLGITQAQLARVLGVSPSTASRLQAGAYRLAPSRKEWEFALLLVRLFRSLDSIAGGEMAKRWMESENRGLSGRPIDLVQTTEGLVRVVQYLDASRGRV